MNIDDQNSIRNLIESLRRYENDLFLKLHTPTRQDDILKITKQYHTEHRIIQSILNNLGRLYEVRQKIDELEKQK